MFKEETKFDDINYWREPTFFEGDDQDFYGFSLYEYFEILKLKGLDEEFAYRTARRLWKKGMRLLEEDYFDKKEKKPVRFKKRNKNPGVGQTYANFV